LLEAGGQEAGGNLVGINLLNAPLPPLDGKEIIVKHVLALGNFRGRGIRI